MVAHSVACLAELKVDQRAETLVAPMVVELAAPKAEHLAANLEQKSAVSMAA